jgi:hypothetical protein
VVARPYLGNRTVDALKLFVCGTSPRPISTGQLRALLPSTSGLSPSGLLGALPGYPVGAIILECASRLDAFSGYHFRT